MTQEALERGQLLLEVMAKKEEEIKHIEYAVCNAPRWDAGYKVQSQADLNAVVFVSAAEMTPIFERELKKKKAEYEKLKKEFEGL